jgi:molybdenum cofactor synthesis domain-containing protein
VLTISDGVHAGVRMDASGGLIERWARDRGYEVSAREAVPDESVALVSALTSWSDELGCDVIITTGGTGLAARDVTPEATRAVLDREATGLAESIRAAGMKKTPYSALSRGVAGIRGSTLIINLPGSPSAVEDGLVVVSDLIEHAVELLRGTATSHD